jgi:hypothetical protein
MTTPIDPHEATAESVIDALEQLMFLAGEWQPDAQRLPAPKTLWAAITMKGKAGFGHFTVVAPEPLARKMASGVLGVGPEAVSENQMFDTVRELVNTACGTLARHLGEEAGYSLGLPEAGYGAPPPKGAVIADEILDVDGEQLLTLVEAL